MNSSTKLPMISIVTPSLNQASFLREALESVQSQQYPAYEHLVFDGGSQDGTVDVLQSAASVDADGRLLWRSGPDGGQSAALNKGFSQASGDIIGWLNADDRYRSGCFEKVAKMFVEHPEVDVVYGDYAFMDGVGRHLKVRREIEFSKFILRYHRVLYIPTTATFFRRRVFDEGNFLSISLHYAMDLEFFLRLAAAGYTFRHLSSVLADFRVHPSSKSIQFIDRQRVEHRSIVLEKTPLVHLSQSLLARNVAASLLQVPAGLLRYSEKLLRGCYWSNGLPSRDAETRFKKGRRS
jgi:glycosyltransferase involved in cell wall biosynthesis